MSSTTNLSTLKINYLTQAQYAEAAENEQLRDNELYMTPGDTTECVEYTSTAPTEPNPIGLKFVVLDEEPAVKYDGWIYLIKG